MADASAPSEKCFKGHVAVKWKDCIVVLCWTHNKKGHDFHEVWTFNLWTELWKKWRNFTTASGRQHRNVKFPRKGHCSVTIQSDIYMFGSDYSHSTRTAAPLWKLTRINGSFEWDIIHTNDDDMMVPSPRSDHCAWEYAEKLWIFGGYGASPALGFLNDHGNFEPKDQFWTDFGWNNQVLCYNLSIQTWANVICSGDVPVPRAHSSVAIINDRAWLHGGSSVRGRNLWYQLYELGMESFVWTQIKSNMAGYAALKGVSITKMTDSQLVLLCLTDKFSQRKCTWILDVPSYTWRPHYASEPDNWDLRFYTVTTGLNSGVIILGGHDKAPMTSNDKDPIITTGNYYEIIDHSQQRTYNPVCFMMVEPKTLQQLAMAAIGKHKIELPWKCLPQKLIRQIKGT